MRAFLQAVVSVAGLLLAAAAVTIVCVLGALALGVASW